MQYDSNHSKSLTTKNLKKNFSGETFPVKRRMQYNLNYAKSSLKAQMSKFIKNIIFSWKLQLLICNIVENILKSNFGLKKDQNHSKSLKSNN